MSLFIPLFIAGLVTSVHCVAMCGTMVAAYGINSKPTDSWAQRALPHLAYQGAKLFSYMAVGLALGAIGSLFDLGGIRGWVSIVAGAFMVAIGVSMTPYGRRLMRYFPKPPAWYVKVLSSLRRRAKGDEAQGRSSLSTPVAFGLMTGFMPCAPLQAAQLAAAGAGSPVDGAIAMLGFGLGTLPLMMVFGLASSKLGETFKKRMAIVGAVVILVLGGVMVDRGATLLGLPFSSASIKVALAGDSGSSDGSFREGPDGIAEVDLVIENVRFAPQSLAIPADRPVRIKVDRRESNACSAQLAIPQLKVFVDLVPDGITYVDVPAAPAGTYTLTCGMGMMAGQIVSYDASAAAPSAQGSPAPSTLKPAAGLIGGDGSQSAGCACCAAGSGEVVEGSSTVEGDVQKITIDMSKGYYEPNRILLTAGVPTEITFGRSSGCTAEVVSEELGFYANLTRGPATIKLGALEPGEYSFSCGMQMVFGTVVVQ